MLRSLSAKCQGTLSLTEPSDFMPLQNRLKTHPCSDDEHLHARDKVEVLQDACTAPRR